MAIWDVTQHGVSGSGDQTNALRVILRHPSVQPTGDSAPDKAEIYFPAREYLIRGDIMSFSSSEPISASRRWTFYGDGPGASIIKFDSQAPSSISSPIIALRGEYTATDQGTNNKWFSIRDLTFDGNARAVAAEWLHLEAASQIRLDRVEFVDIKGAQTDELGIALTCRPVSAKGMSSPFRFGRKLQQVKDRPTLEDGE